MPISLAEIKNHVRVTSDDDDALLRSYTSAAVAYCEKQTGGRSIMLQTWDWKLHLWPGVSFEIPRPPLQSVTSVKYYATDTSTAATTIGSSEYLVHTPTEVPGILERHPKTSSWPSIANRADAVTVRFVSGSTDTPEELRHAIKLLVGHFYDNRNAAAALNADLAQGVAALLRSVESGNYT